jgi:hypothetical protein
MTSEARKQAGEAFGRGDIETVMADLITPNGVLWKSGAVLPSAPGKGLGYLTHHRIFACLSGNCGLREITTGDGEQGGEDE